MKKPSLIKSFIQEEKAQATVEYALTLALVAAIALLIVNESQDILKAFWNAIVNKVAKGCPNCD
ncbi:MAG: hypothetical protein HYW47_04375 [Deltaproteobacteria bacterium]|nr:hypothetical protein [Deltaproteobacteria bacterium]